MGAKHSQSQVSIFFFPKLLLKIIVEFELKRYFDNYLSPTGYALKAN